MFVGILNPDNVSFCREEDVSLEQFGGKKKWMEKFFLKREPLGVG